MLQVRRQSVNWPFTAVLGVLLLVASGMLASAAETSSTPQSQWSARMRKMGESLERLVVAASGEGALLSTKNTKVLQGESKRLLELAEDLSRVRFGSTGESPDGDPTLRWISKVFVEDLREVSRTLKNGDGAYARSLVRTLPGYCVACHTRGPWGPAFPEAKENPALKGLPPYDRGTTYIALRQYDRALEAFRESSRELQPSFIRERTLRAALAVAVRVKRDPLLALQVLSQAVPDRSTVEGAQVDASLDVPEFLREEAAQWRQALEIWKNEKSVPSDPLAEAKRLLAEGVRHQKYPSDRSGDVWFLRASSLIHDWLGSHPTGLQTGTQVGEAYFMGGQAYEALRGITAPSALYDLDQLFFLGCIVQAPHSELAQKCYRRYESSIYSGFTGSRGTSLPADVRERLRELRGLAFPPASRQIQSVGPG